MDYQYKYKSKNQITIWKGWPNLKNTERTGFHALIVWTLKIWEIILNRNDKENVSILSQTLK